MKTNMNVSAILLASSAALSAATYNANWMDLSVDTLSSTPIASNANIPQFSQFNLPGYGNVRVSVSASPVFVTTGPVSDNLVRGTGTLDDNGSITVDRTPSSGESRIASTASIVDRVSPD